MVKDGESSVFHPALGISNIKNAMPLILDREKVQYSNWVELFEYHAHVFDVLDHIDPKTPRPTDLSNTMWKMLDFVVKNGIYGTISTDLLETILCKGDTTQQVWNKLKEIFQDNKTTRVVYLENQFNQLHLSKFSDISSYCRELIKNLKDQLANVDQPVSEKKLVIRLVSGLVNTNFDTVAAMIQQTTSLPSFETVISCLLLEESRRASDSSPQASSFVAQSGNTSGSSASLQMQAAPAGQAGGSNGRGRGRGRG
ncbi:uncharacterized protein LOC110704357 [Chenopodium quinoa]|uniref:uncharacterized protein LOC110704357 n=1 Tax=Chenopodium quinoa TaxID=63459 RepID=UPI000B78D73D|nr:uncharacterized protein LOC110704357 [Chenopodium quinoa]